MAELNLKVKPTSGGAMFDVKVLPSATILDLKAAVSPHCDAAVEQLRLIYKGQVLKDHETVESYGLANDHVVHMVKSRAQPAAQSPSSPAPPLASAAAAAAGPLGGALGANPQEQLRSMMANPMVQSLMQNPDFIRTTMQSNPQVRAMMEANPEMAAALNDPSTLAEIGRVMQNPDLLRQHTRNMDLALTNLESMPGGFNALRQVHEQMARPAAEPSEAAAAGANPFSGLFAPPAAAPGEPMPNPWAPPPAAAGAGAGASAGAGGGGLPDLFGAGFPGLGGLGGADLASPEMAQMAASVMQNPAMRQLMGSQVQAMMSTPEGQAQMQAQMRAMLDSHPALQGGVGANPALREALSNPETMRAMWSPANIEAMGQMMAAMNPGGGGAGGAIARNPPLPNLGAAGAGAAGAAGAAGGAPDFSALMGLLGGGGLGGFAGGGGFGAPAPPADPEAAYASQLQQLQDMGFYDRQENLRALLAAGGNVNAAVERLLASV